jgi:hypothetical protein
MCACAGLRCSFCAPWPMLQPPLQQLGLMSLPPPFELSVAFANGDELVCREVLCMPPLAVGRHTQVPRSQQWTLRSATRVVCSVVASRVTVSALFDYPALLIFGCLFVHDKSWCSWFACASSDVPHGSLHAES